MDFFINQLDYNDLFDWIHLVNMYNFNQNGEWFQQMKHLINIANVF
jgi:hypothetical protein